MSTSGAKVELIDLLHPVLLAEAVRFKRREQEAEGNGLATLTVEKLQNMTKVSRRILQYHPPISSCVTALLGRHHCRHVPQPADVPSRFIIILVFCFERHIRVRASWVKVCAINPNDISSPGVE